MSGNDFLKQNEAMVLGALVMRDIRESDDPEFRIPLWGKNRTNAMVIVRTGLDKYGQFTSQITGEGEGYYPAPTKYSDALVNAHRIGIAKLVASPYAPSEGATGYSTNFVDRSCWRRPYPVPDDVKAVRLVFLKGRFMKYYENYGMLSEIGWEPVQ